MEMQRVDAGRGIAWLTEAVQLLLANPAPFALMGLIVGAIAMVPLAGTLVLAIAGPALYGGMMLAAAGQQSGRPPEVGQLFAAFQQPGKAGPMLVLCLPAVLAGVIVLALGVVLMGSALVAAGVGASMKADALAGLSLGGGFVLFLLVTVAVGLVSWATVFFATPRVMLDGIEPMRAIRESLAASAANWTALLLFAVCLMVLTLVLGLLLGWIPVLGPLAMTTVLSPLYAAGAFLAYREVFAGAAPIAPPPPPATGD